MRFFKKEKKILLPENDSVFTLKKNKKGYQTELHKAVIVGDVAKVKKLVLQGENVNQIDSHGLTALDLALVHDFSKTIHILQQHGAKKSRELK